MEREGVTLATIESKYGLQLYSPILIIDVPNQTLAATIGGRASRSIGVTSDSGSAGADRPNSLTKSSPAASWRGAYSKQRQYLTAVLTGRSSIARSNFCNSHSLICQACLKLGLLPCEST